MDAKFKVMNGFIFKGSLRREGIILELSDVIVKQEIKKGNHPDSKKPMSGLLNHCVPADDFTRELVQDVKGIKLDEVPDEQSTEEEIEKLRKEFDKIGKAYHPAWRVARLKKELLKAQKEQPEKPLVEGKQKSEKVK